MSKNKTHNQLPHGLASKVEEIRNLIEARRIGLFDIWNKMRTLEESQEWKESGATSFRQFALQRFGIKTSEYENYYAAHQFMTHDEMVAIGQGAVKEFIKIMRIDKGVHSLAKKLYSITLISIEKYRSDNGYYPSGQTQATLVRNAAKQAGISIESTEQPSSREKYNLLVEALKQVVQMGSYGTPPQGIAEYAESILIEAGHQPPTKKAKAA